MYFFMEFHLNPIQTPAAQHCFTVFSDPGSAGASKKCGDIRALLCTLRNMFIIFYSVSD